MAPRVAIAKAAPVVIAKAVAVSATARRVAVRKAKRPLHSAIEANP
jgi:hypothetical protein